MPPEMIFLIIALSLIGAFAFVFLVYLLLIRTKRPSEIMKKYKNLNFAHRGLHKKGVPENSLSAFRAALDAGFGIELDVRLSADGELVVFHDDTLTRVTGIEKRVDELTLSELKRIRLLDTDQRVPDFREVLELISGKVPILIEIKEDAGKTDVTEALVRELVGYKGPYIVESFNPLSLKAFRKARGDVPIGILAENFSLDEKYKGKILYFLLKNMLLNFLSVPDFVAYRHTDSNMPSLKLTRAIYGTPSFAWTVRTKEEAKVAKEAGFDAVIFENYIEDEGSAIGADLPIYVN